MRKRAFVGLVLVVSAALTVPPVFASSPLDRTISDSRVTESSGLAPSALHPGVLYTHNDSEAGPEVFAIAADGSTAAVLTLEGAQARDWEGMSPGRAGTDTVWVGDIGDNIDGWVSYTVYRFKEPKQLEDRTVDATAYQLQFADGESRNAESLLVHPVTGRLYVVTKEVRGPALYVAPEKLTTDGPNELTRVAKSLLYATDAAFSPNGRYFVVRGYVDAAVYATSDPGKRVASIDLPAQPQGESIAWATDGSFLYAGSEGRSSKIFRVELPEDIASTAAVTSTPSAGSSTSASSGPTTTADPTDPESGIPGDSGSGGLPRAQLVWLALGALVLIALGFSLRAWSRHDPDEA